MSLFPRNKQGSTALDILQRMNTNPAAATLLQQLQEEELEQAEMAGMNSFQKALHTLKLVASDALRDLGWKVTLIVFILIIIIAWQFAVYLHGQSPLHTKSFHD